MQFKVPTYCQLPIQSRVCVNFCIEFTWQLFGSSKRKRDAGVASVRRHQELTPYQTEPVLGSSKTDSLLVKAEPISDFGSASVTIYL